MNILVFLLIICCVLLLSYVINTHIQIRKINYQLKERWIQGSKQWITFNLSNKDMGELVTNINRALKEEDQLRSKAVHNEREFKQLIANISHDLRTPLTAIRGYLQLVERGKLTEVEAKNLLVAKKYTEELGTLIEHFYEYSYLLDAKPEIHIERLNLTNLVIECIASSVTMFEEQNLSVKINENPPVIAFVDREMIIRCVQNLIRNCVAHSAGDVVVEIKKGEQAEIHFTNPVKSEYQVNPNQIFERFYTGDASRHRSTGLGLSIVKLLVELMGGFVRAELHGNQLEIIILLQSE